MELYELTIAEAHRLLKDKEISSQELTRAVLDRIDAKEQQVDAFPKDEHEQHPGTNPTCFFEVFWLGDPPAFFQLLDQGFGSFAGFGQILAVDQDAVDDQSDKDYQ